ncbi:unnamed protein product [Leptosia nina]|uniref:Uncharacterized protein n=1 Tax=Leptosia nina TaxID=320188 RepID=A0AAV1JLB9_9NEOP
MAPVKFGLFKARSRDQQDQPSTENLLKSSHSIDQAGAPSSPIPSTSKGLVEDLSPLDFAILNLDDDDDEDISEGNVSRRGSECSKVEDANVNYRQLQNPSLTSTSTLDDLDQIHIYDEPATQIDAASTSYDANSSQFDVDASQFDVNSSEFDVTSQYEINSQFDASSIAPSEDLSVYCAMLKKPKKSRSKEQQLRDIDMWQASNIEVMQNLLNRSGTLDEQIKWEAIATSRGLCTLTDSCTCDDCTGAKYLAGVTDGDGGLGTAPLFNAINQIKWEAIATSRGLCTLTDSCTCDDCTGAKYLAGVTDGDGGLGTAPLFNAINQIKWEAIATSRGLCTLTDSCTCDDCTGAKYLAGVTDGDGGLGTAPLFNAINVGCQIQ